MPHKRFRWIATSIFVLIVVVGSSLVFAGQSFYVTDKSARTGMIMSLSNNQGVATPASLENISSLVGVLNETEAEIDIEPGQVNVQTDGLGSVLVSTINGDIKVGDKITASSLVGIGAKLSSSNGWIVGIAQGSLDASTPGAVKSSITDATGAPKEVLVATIPMLVNVTYFNDKASEEPSAVPNRLQKIVDSIAGKRASQAAIFLSFFLLIAGIVVASVITNTAVRNGIQSAARQPLAKKDTMRRMIQACAAAFGILLATIASALVIIRIL